MDNKIKDTSISCPECGASGLFTCTNCKNEIKFNLQWNGKKDEVEKAAEEPKKEKPLKKSLYTIEKGNIEELTKEVIDGVVTEERLKSKKEEGNKEEAARQRQSLIDDIKASLQDDVKSLIIEAVCIMKKDLLDALKTERKKKEPEAKIEKTKREEPQKVSAKPAEDESKEKVAKETLDKVYERIRKEEIIKTDIKKEDLPKEDLKDENDEERKTSKIIKNIEKLKKESPNNGNNNENDFLDSLELWELYKEIINKKHQEST